MANGVNAAIETATKLDEIGFPEFTTKLIGDTFDSLIAANLRQQQAYIELVRELGKDLKTYINETKDDIGPAEILMLLSAAAPPDNPTATSAPTKVAEGNSLTAAEVTTVNNALEVTGGGVTSDNKVAENGNLTQARVDKIMEAAAIRIAANKYTLLQEMVKQGLLRLVVENGSIETRLNFRTYGSDYLTKTTHDAHRDSFAFRAKAKSGGLVSLWVKAAASTSYTSVNVSTVDTRSSSFASTTVDIYGGVKINFRTDYLPLDQG